MPKQAKRFQLDPNQTAQENLWRAAEIAQRYLLKRMRFRVLPDQRRELYDAILLAGVENFILNKVLKHRYNYQYDFFSNVYSFIKVQRAVHKADISFWICFFYGFAYQFNKYI